MILRLRFGTGAEIADLRGLKCQVLESSAPRHHPPASELVDRALDAPVGSPALEDLARNAARVTVLVPDATRKVELPQILPRVLARLEAAGVPGAGVTILVACGTHPAAEPGALRSLLGPLPDGTRIVQHDARDDSSLVEVGTTPQGTRIRINRLAVDCDLLMAISSVQHHYFAGFGGGPKLVFPGVAGYEETQANHSRVIEIGDGGGRRVTACDAGRLEGNPVAEEIAAAAALNPPAMIVAVVNDSEGRAAWASAGMLGEVFAAACAQVRAWYEVSAGPFRRIVVTAGGDPTDATLIQAHKALEAACRFAAPDAEVLFVAACGQGPGSPAMEPFLADPRPETILARLDRHYVQYGHTTLRLVEKTGRYRVLILSRLGDELSRRLGMEPVASVQSVLDRWREQDPGETVAVIPGAVVYPPLARG